MIELRAGSARCTVSAVDGGRVATLNAGGVDLIVGPDPSLPATGWGSFPMVPWAGRVRNGRFSFDGVDYQMPINFGPHAIHGTGFDQPWEVVARNACSMSMRCPLTWEFGGESEQLIELAEDSLTCTLTARAGDRPMPVTIGWHPWFVKPVRVDLQFTQMYLRDDDYIPDGRMAAPSPPPWDDCFVGLLATPRLWIGGVEVSITSDCDHWVVYDMPVHATCVEPQTAPPDAFNLTGNLTGNLTSNLTGNLTGNLTSATRLQPGEELRRHMTIGWR